MPKPSKGLTVRYVSDQGEVAVAIITNVFPEDRVNLAIIRDGVNQAHLPDFAYTADFAPIAPDGAMQPNTWHWA